MNEKDSSRNSYFIRGNIKLDLDILLEVNLPDMENILLALADFIEETDRF
jgi:hypothetical protein